jgi:polyhydroxyalkanoate synthesis regulator protein
MFAKGNIGSTSDKLFSTSFLQKLQKKYAKCMRYMMKSTMEQNFKARNIENVE